MTYFKNFRRKKRNFWNKDHFGLATFFTAFSPKLRFCDKNENETDFSVDL